MQFLSVASIIFIWPTCNLSNLTFLSDTFIDSINKKQSDWVADRNFPETTTLTHLERLIGGYNISEYSKFARKLEYPTLEIDVIPESFDSRTNWPYCESIKKITDLGNCGASWAAGPASVMTDRYCIATMGAQKFEFSVQDIVSCCKSCVINDTTPCDRGVATSVWKYWITEGIVSGGHYNSHQGCQPFSESSFVNGTAHKCRTTCYNSYYNTPYQRDKQYGYAAYRVKGIKDIQSEIMTEGPVAALVQVYDDFFSYRNGIYRHVLGDDKNLHSVKILGWGKNKFIDYWLVANTWGTKWGDNGFFKILKGTDHCKIEAVVAAARPNCSSPPRSNSSSTFPSVIAHTILFLCIIVWFLNTF